MDLGRTPPAERSLALRHGSDASRYLGVVQALFSTGCQSDTSYLVWLSAGHPDAAILRFFLAQPDVNPLKTYRGSKYETKTSALQEAAAYGGEVTVQELLKYLKEKGISPTEFLNRSHSHADYLDGENAFDEAFKHENFKCLKHLIKSEADVRRRDDMGRTLLHRAAGAMHLETLETLLGEGACVSDKDKWGFTAFTYLYSEALGDLFFEEDIQKSYLKSVQILTKAGSDVNERDGNGETCLHKAARYGDMDTVRYLCEKSANVNQTDTEGKAPLHKAIDKCDLDTIKNLVSTGANVEAIDSGGRNVIHFAASSRVDTLEKIMYFKDTHNMSVHGEDRLGRTVLFYAVESGDEEIVELFVDMGLDTNTQDNEGTTLLHIACGKTQTHSEVFSYKVIDSHIVNFLLEKGTDQFLRDKDGCFPLHYLAKQIGRGQDMYLLIEKGADPNARDCNNCTPLHYAVLDDGVEENVEILLEKGADVQARDKDGCTPLHAAARESDGLDTTRLLLEKGADLTARNNQGCTPLHCAADESDCEETVELFLDEGADPCTQDKEGYIPLHYATQKGCEESMEVLLQGDAGLSTRDMYGRTPLHYAAKQHCGTGPMELLLDKGADPLVRDADGCTPLHYAAEQVGYEPYVEVLIERGADVNVQNNDGLTPLHYAAGHRGGDKTVKILLQNGADPRIQDKEGSTPLHFAFKGSDCSATVNLLQDFTNILEEMALKEEPMAHHDVEQVKGSRSQPPGYSTWCPDTYASCVTADGGWSQPEGMDVSVNTFMSFDGSHTVNNITGCDDIVVINSIKAKDVAIRSKTSVINTIEHQGTAQSSPSPFENLVSSTWGLIHEAEAKPYVSTGSARTAFRLLHQYGSIFIKGKSGSGKTRLALRLLSHISKKTGRKPVNISQWEQWDYIPKTFNKTKFVVLIDDIYGSDNLNNDRIRECERYFDIMWPQVESGDIFCILTSRSEIAILCKYRMKKYDIVKKALCVDMDGNKYPLTSNEKGNMLKKICGLDISEDDFLRTEDVEISLGFVQCCVFFTSCKEAQMKGIAFFLQPTEFIVAEVNKLQINDSIGYLVLLIVLMCKGELDVRQIHPIKCQIGMLIANLKECCNMTGNVSLSYIKDKADSLCGTYLRHTGLGYAFHHQSVHDAVFMTFMKRYPGICIDVCSPDMLIGLVRTDTVGDTVNTVCLPEHCFPALAVRLTNLLVSGDCHILDHPSFHHDDFVQLLLGSWTDELLTKLLLQDLKPATVSVPHPMLPGKKILICTYSKLSTAFILNKHKHVVRQLLSRMRDRCNFTSPDLACAIYVQDDDIVSELIQIGVTPDVDCFRALCHSECDKKITDDIYQHLECHIKSVIDLEDLFSLAVMNGNIYVVQLLVRKLKECRLHMDTFQNQLVMLLFARGRKNLKGRHVLNEAGWGKCYFDIIVALFTAGGDMDISYLAWLSASHPDATALRYFLQNPNVNPLKRFRCPDLLYRHTSSVQQAAAFGGAECMHELIEYSTQKGISIYECVNGLVDEDDSPLELALAYCNYHCMTYLISRGADVSRRNSFGETLLHAAARDMNLDAVNILLDHGASVNEVDHEGSTPFAYLYLDDQYYRNNFCSSAIGTVRALLEAGSDVNESDIEGNTCILKAAYIGDTQTIRYLCDAGAELNLKYKEGKTVLHHVTENCDLETTKYLIAKGAEVDEVDDWGRNVMQYSAWSMKDTVEKLLYYSAAHNLATNGTDRLGRTLLFYAVECDEEAVEMLVEAGLDIHATDADNATLLHAACRQQKRSSCESIVMFLVEKGVDPLLKDKHGRTPLHYAARERHCEKIVQSLLNARADHNAVDNDGSTPLHYAARAGSGGLTIQLLLEKGADPGVQDEAGCTPLHLAVMSKDEHSVTLLLDGGADPCISDIEGRTALNYAILSHQEDIVKLLVEKGNL
ncbi:uncharacterized protein [Haliotis asinina]|uniref:uncharacterized protein n=1 Tax=Haliotis asinina TaxID=109174 RepID=UPI003531D58B